MLTIRTSFQINDSFLNRLSRLINGEIQHVSSVGTEVDLGSPNKYYDNLLLVVSEEGTCYKLFIRSLFFYSETIGDDVENLQISIKADSKLRSQNGEATFLGDQIFKIRKIKIYGEERIRVWSDMKKMDYFQKNVELKISDYYFNNTIIRFESFDNRFVNIFAGRDMVNIILKENLNLESDFYDISDLDMEKDFDDDGNVWSNVQRIKCHYEIDEHGIKKYVTAPTQKGLSTL